MCFKVFFGGLAWIGNYIIMRNTKWNEHVSKIEMNEEETCFSSGRSEYHSGIFHNIRNMLRHDNDQHKLGEKKTWPQDWLVVAKSHSISTVIALKRQSNQIPQFSPWQHQASQSTLHTRKKTQYNTTHKENHIIIIIYYHYCITINVT